VALGFRIGFRNINLKEALFIFLSFYAGLIVTMAFYAVTRYYTRNPIYADIVFSLVGGGMMQIYFWRNNNFKGKNLLIVLNTIFAGWLFGIIWGFNILQHPGYGLKVTYAFSSWFVIVGSITVIIKLFFHPPVPQ
jgi:hypothetical protein